MQNSKSFRGPILTLSVITSLILVLILFPSSFHFDFLKLRSSTHSDSVAEIPNIVHFVHFATPPSATNLEPTILFEFSHFIAIYSAHLFLKPVLIYIHTDAHNRLSAKAKESTDRWTRLIANLPSVRFNYVVPPERTSRGGPIRKLPHKSDFIRTQVMKKYGGIYLDEDSYVLRDFASLRRAGFRNVVGRQKDGQIGSATFLSMPESDLITAYQAQQDSVYDGNWLTHAVMLLSSLVRHFGAVEKEVLVLEQNAFFPLGWEKDDLKSMYSINEAEIMGEWSYTAKVMTKILNWNNSYAIHGYHTALLTEKIDFGIFGGITLEYVLARTSNFARAVYPAVEHAMKQGIV